MLGPGRWDAIQCFRGRGRFADNREVGIALEEGSEAGPHDLMVIKEKDADRHPSFVALLLTVLDVTSTLMRPGSLAVAGGWTKRPALPRLLPESVVVI